MYLDKNRMFNNKVKHSIILGQKEKALGAKRKKVVALIKSLIYSRVKLRLEGHAIKD